VCSNYFSKYELDLDELKIRITNLQDKYKDWQRILIEPATINDARLFSVETRLNEEEEMRIREYEYMRDLMKKLLYSLEQVNMQNIDKKGLDTLALNVEQMVGQVEGGGSMVGDKLPEVPMADQKRMSMQGQIPG